MRRVQAMPITRKIKYAIRAVFETAKRQHRGPARAALVAETRKTLLRFLEVILNHLKHSGIVIAKMGYQGGYKRAREPDIISVGDIFRHMESKNHSLICISGAENDDCELIGAGAFLPIWEKGNGPR